MSQPFSFRPARRSEAKPLIGIHSQSGAGKTYSALLLARGFVGPTGRIGMIETESGRGESYADPNEYPELRGPDATNYDVCPLREEFSAESYGRAMTAAERAKYDALIIDSASHEWESVGGVLDEADKRDKAGKKGPLVWQEPKINHRKHFVLRFMQTPIPLVILCMRSRYPMKEVQKREGGTTWARSKTLEPIQSEDVLFEMFAHGWISLGDHVFHVGKCTNRSLRPILETGEPITLETGQRLAAWTAGDRSLGGDLEQIFQSAAAAARLGRKAFKKWWNTAGKEKPRPDGGTARFLLQDRLPELERILSQVEPHHEPDEDPFGSPRIEDGYSGGPTEGDMVDDDEQDNPNVTADIVALDGAVLHKAESFADAVSFLQQYGRRKGPASQAALVERNRQTVEGLKAQGARNEHLQIWQTMTNGGQSRTLL